ncbi:MAG: tetratricopeptide repeat protein [Magnetococcales bacterium]|nr:tetratricopeptide repeat protein [Magnetococcales bacterium]
MNRAEKRRQKKLAAKNSNPNKSTNTATDGVDELFQKAINFHHAGQMDQAISLYEQVIKLMPQNSIALSNMGVALQSTGRILEATTCYKKAIAINPEYVGALSNLGFAFTELNRLDEAAATLQKAVAINPNHAEAHFNLANVQKAQEQYSHAVISYQKATTLNPQYVDAYYNLAITLQLQNRIADAVINYQKAIELKPDFANAYYNLAIIFQELQKLDQAAQCYQQAVAIVPNWAEAHLNLGITLQAQNRLDDAIAICQKAIDLKPDFAQAYYNLGNMLRAQNRLYDAVNSYQKATELNSDIAEAHYNLAITLQDLGLQDEGVVSCKKAIAINPNYGDAHYNLGCHYEKINNIPLAKKHIKKSIDINPNSPYANCLWAYLLRREGKIDEAIELLEPFAKIEFANNDEASLVHFELGKLFDIKKDSAKAFNHLKKANMFQAQGDKRLLTDKEKFLNDIKQTRETLTVQWLESWSNIEQNSRDPSPLFLVGFPRSGTTLLDQILDSHPKIEVMEEKPALYDVIQLINSSYPACLASLQEGDIRHLQKSYFAAVDRYMNRNPDKILIDKLPLNIRHISLIKRIFPHAKIILAMRHPCDIILSNFMQYYKLNNAMSNFLTLEDTVHAYVQVMELWLQSADLLQIEHHTIKYESLVADFAGEVGELLKFIDVAWDDSVMEYNKHAQKRGIINTPSYQSVTQPIYQRAKYRWRRYEEYLTPHLGRLEPLIKTFGYS